MAHTPMDPENPFWFPDGEEPRGDPDRLRARGMHREADELERLRHQMKLMRDAAAYVDGLFRGDRAYERSGSGARLRAAMDGQDLAPSFTDEEKP